MLREHSLTIYVKKVFGDWFSLLTIDILPINSILCFEYLFRISVSNICFEYLFRISVSNICFEYLFRISEAETMEMLRRLSATLVKLVAGGILIFAAVMKISFYGNQIVTGSSGIYGCVVLVFASVELLTGCWLASSFKPGLGWDVGIATFTIIVAIGFLQFEMGRTTCHCFGSPMTPISLSLSLAVGCLGMLVAFRSLRRFES